MLHDMDPVPENGVFAGVQLQAGLADAPPATPSTAKAASTTKDCLKVVSPLGTPGHRAYFTLAEPAYSVEDEGHFIRMMSRFLDKVGTAGTDR
jgi:hypothetical protein